MEEYLDLIKINKKELSKLLDTDENIIIFRRGSNDPVFKTSRKYTDKVGKYMIELDEFTDTYLNEFANLYGKFASDEELAFYIRMFDVIDYEQSHHQEFFKQLYNLISNHNYQFIIDFNITSKNTDKAIIYEYIPSPVLNKFFMYKM